MITEPASFLRVIGATMILSLTSEIVISAIDGLRGLSTLDSLFFYAVIAWPVNSLGSWLWSFEGGWFALQRWLRIIQIATFAAVVLMPFISYTMKHFPFVS